MGQHTCLLPHKHACTSK